MLKWIDNKTVEGSGFKVVVPDIHTVRYMEKSRHTNVEIEGGVKEGQIDWLVYTSTLSVWEMGGAKESMDDAERIMVLARISEALTLLNMPHHLV